MRATAPQLKSFAFLGWLCSAKTREGRLVEGTDEHGGDASSGHSPAQGEGCQEKYNRSAMRNATLSTMQGLARAAEKPPAQEQWRTMEITMENNGNNNAQINRNSGRMPTHRAVI